VARPARDERVVPGAELEAPVADKNAVAEAGLRPRPRMKETQSEP
jgi:hypothetical protein